mmetsp:Transcript_130514/g.325591  ORF Transcript_130514/g.325591 Transcript_130514/m.325591 type:complete len:231 (-) Transcript_130514:625-1317(-)
MRRSRNCFATTPSRFTQESTSSPCMLWDAARAIRACISGTLVEDLLSESCRAIVACAANLARARMYRGRLGSLIVNPRARCSWISMVVKQSWIMVARLMLFFRGATPPHLSSPACAVHSLSALLISNTTFISFLVMYPRAKAWILIAGPVKALRLASSRARYKSDLRKVLVLPQAMSVSLNFSAGITLGSRLIRVFAAAYPSEFMDKKKLDEDFAFFNRPALSSFETNRR